MTVKTNSLMNALVELDQSPKKGRVDFSAAMQQLGIDSVFDIIRLPRSEFARRLMSLSDADPDLAYENATRYAALIGRLYREYKTTSNNIQQLAPRTGVRALTKAGPTWQGEFNEDWDSFVKVGAMAAIDSPVAYLAALWAFIHQLEATKHAPEDPIDPQRVLLDKPVEEEVPRRWRVSEPVEYNNKGEKVRIYRPYFADWWGYVNDQSMREHAFHDKQFYDAAGRPTKTVLARKMLQGNPAELKPLCRETWYWIWGTVAFDENDLFDPPAPPPRRTDRTLH